MKRRQDFFGRDIEPACRYCEHGTPIRDGMAILCKRAGVSAPGHSCRHFFYDPLRRVPKMTPDLPTYRPEDFEL